MAGLLPFELPDVTGWLDAQKRAALREIAGLLADPRGTLTTNLASAAENLKGMSSPDVKNYLLGDPMANLEQGNQQMINNWGGFVGPLKNFGTTLSNKADAMYQGYLAKGLSPADAKASAAVQFNLTYPHLIGSFEKNFVPPGAALGPEDWAAELKQFAKDTQEPPVVARPDQPRTASYWTGETPEQIDAKMQLAQANAALPVEQGGLGLPPDNTAAMRAASPDWPTGGSFGNITNKQEDWHRGFNTPRPELRPPSETMTPEAAAFTATGWQAPYNFVSRPFSLGYTMFGQDSMPLRTNIDPLKYFDPRESEHMQLLKDTYRNLIDNPPDPASIPDYYNRYNVLTGQQEPLQFTENGLKNIEDAGNFRDPRTRWAEFEKPDTTYAIKEVLGFPGILTKEGQGTGQNVGTIEQNRFRSPLAAFDPMQANSPNLFAGWGPAAAVTPLAALLAAQGLPVGDQQ
jgi:hypothetical protein